MSDYFFKYMIFDTRLYGRDLFEFAEDRSGRIISDGDDAPTVCLLSNRLLTV